VLYSSELSVVGLNEADLQTPIPGVVSAIHLHNAPAGINGPVVQDTLVDAGATLDTDGATPSGVFGPDVIENTVETDVLTSIENVIGSDDGDVITGSNQDNVLNGGDGDDTITGAGGDDILFGGEGADSFLFDTDFGHDVIEAFELGIDRLSFGDFGSRNQTPSNAPGRRCTKVLSPSRSSACFSTCSSSQGPFTCFRSMTGF